MKTHLSPSLSSLILFFIPFSMFAQSGKLIQSNAYGCSFNAPVGWIHQDLGSGNHLFGSNEIAGVIAVLQHDYNGKEEIKTYAQTQGIDEDGMSLQAIGSLTYFSSNGIKGTFVGWIDGSKAKVAVISLFSPNGGGVSIFAATSPEQFNSSYMTLAEGIANSVKFKRPVESNLVRQWTQGLSNKKLTYYNTTDYAAEKRIYFLYANGQFSYKDESSYSSTDHYTDHSSTFSSVSSGKNSGLWKVIGDDHEVQLQLTYSDGSVYNLSLQLKEGTETQVLINGNRYFTSDL